MLSNYVFGGCTIVIKIVSGETLGYDFYSCTIIDSCESEPPPTQSPWFPSHALFPIAIHLVPCVLIQYPYYWVFCEFAAATHVFLLYYTVLSAYRVELTKNHSAFVQTVISREHNIFKGNCLIHVISLFRAKRGSNQVHLCCTLS